jgi:hypothetical protein
MDIIIATTNTKRQEDYWHKRLRLLRGVICNSNAFVIVVHEDWPQGAGTGLGTLFAYHKAQEKAKYMYRTDLYEMQRNGASVAIFHNSGVDKKLYPILASELNSKSDIKLPGKLDNRRLTLLEAVIAQTNRPTFHPKGRLTAYWGDKILIPRKQFAIPGSHHIEVLCKSQKNFGPFSLSPQITFALLREFEKELQEKRGKLEAEEHFWMPLTVDFPTYAVIMGKRGITPEESFSHYRRMQKFKAKFLYLHSEHQFIRSVDVGPQSYLWDYSSTGGYYQNMLKLTSPDHEAQIMKIFYNISHKDKPGRSNRLISDKNSCLVDCHIQSGKIINSVLIGVTAASLEAQNCVMIHSTFSSVVANYCLFYNVQETENIRFSPGTIRADLSLPKSKEQVILYSHQDRNSKVDWNTRLPQNLFSFKEIYQRIILESLP